MQQVLSDELDSIAIGQVVQAHVNVRKNVIAVDATAVPAMQALLPTVAMCVVPVRECLPRPPNTSVGVIRDVAENISNGKTAAKQPPYGSMSHEYGEKVLDQHWFERQLLKELYTPSIPHPFVYTPTALLTGCLAK